VWKLSTSAALTSPVDLVSTSVACQIVLSGNVWVLDSAVPANVAATSAAGALSSPARQCRVMVSNRLANPTACPNPNVTFFDIFRLQNKKGRRLDGAEWFRPRNTAALDRVALMLVTS
jgi:hypothetical protein